MDMLLDDSVVYLSGVGPEKAGLIHSELGVRTIRDLLYFFPFRYVDKTKVNQIKDLEPDNEEAVLLRGKIANISMKGKGRAKRLHARFSDGTDTLELVWFKGAQWIQKSLKPGVVCQVYGKLSWYMTQATLAHPEIEYSWSEAGALEPVYSSTEKLQSKNLGAKGIQKLIKQALGKYPEFPDSVPTDIRNELKLLPLAQALWDIHFPKTEKDAHWARQNMVFRELFELQMFLVQQKKWLESRFSGFLFPEIGAEFQTFYTEYLPFPLTNAQKRVIKEIRGNFNTGIQMNRLLQGDVGSGKTIVALLTMLIAIGNGFQACIMAPTEILANQHLESITELLEKMDIKVALLTGSIKKRDRTPIHEGLLSGEINILVGTHALLEDVVQFKNLGLAIIDEQHRFGVAQRSKLWKKNIQPPHMLVMTATPIPRTLAMTVYGDLDVSVIDELPPGRKPVQTLHRSESHRLRLFAFMESEIAKGRQVYIVYPLIQESEALDYKDLMEGFESIQRRFPLPKYKISMVHGKMKPEDKNFEMDRFVKGESQIMVATTVIEVGVNVPNASVMIIESAERFGLSQLHQLRGRVGRGAESSYCILLTGEKVSKEARHRMKVMTTTNDGFVVSEEDLKLRGPGDMMGTQQSGIMEMKIADLKRDGHILEKAREVAKKIIQEDPHLKSKNHAILKDTLDRRFKTSALWGKIS
ncbi:MAG: ATP-dependent DNA helicase RecG [Luteibaculaceae bacterium]|jgi:ATP-dependent DNA helicase RecG